MGEELEGQSDGKGGGFEAGKEQHEHQIQSNRLRQHRLLLFKLFQHIIEEISLCFPRPLSPLSKHLPQHLHRLLSPLINAFYITFNKQTYFHSYSFSYIPTCKHLWYAVPGMFKGNEISPLIKASKLPLRLSGDSQLISFFEARSNIIYTREQ